MTVSMAFSDNRQSWKLIPKRPAAAQAENCVFRPLKRPPEHINIALIACNDQCVQPYEHTVWHRKALILCFHLVHPAS